ncbi:MAG TPA: RlmE family RNA methyltransferase [Acidiferrobacterales bacterium]|nr:RlmE family RNA methyltransferase [Acidiferrobacterales bacterium]
MGRTKSSDAWLREHFDDEFVKRAQKEGFRSRAVYKLIEIDQRGHLLTPGMTVVDLGAAPGGWSQYAKQRVGVRGRVLALDLLPMPPVAGVEFIQGDFTEQDTLDLLLSALSGMPVDLVISDMAPNISGIAVSDQAKTMYLAELALDFAQQCLRPQGRLLIKTFQGQGFNGLYKRLQANFSKVITRKPRASRARSREIYLLGKEFHGANV